MFGSDKGTPPALDGKKRSIGMVVSRFNSHITQAMQETCKAELLKQGVLEKNITIIKVSGALEIPLVLQALAKRDDFDALIAIGCVIRGETYHFELVANESASGITRVSLDNQTPIINAILTVENHEQALIRQTSKATEAAQIALEMATILEKIL